MDKTHPRVLVGSPVTSLKEYCIPGYPESLKSLSYKNREILVLDNSPAEKPLSDVFRSAGIKCIKTPHTNNAREMVCRDRNFLRKKSLEEGFDYFLSLEQDILPPSDIIERLLATKKEIVSGAYFNFSHEESISTPRPNFFSLINPGDKTTFITRRLAFEDLWPSRLIKVFLAGFGCILIHKSVLEKIEFRLEKSLGAYDDVFFCRDANKAGFGVFLDSRIACRHFNKPHSKELREKLWSK